MQSFGQMALPGFAICVALAGFMNGCGTSRGTAPSGNQTETAELEVVQVTTLTTVQASHGSFLSASPQQDVPSYVEHGAASAAAEPTSTLERAKVDLALLFQSPSESELPQLRAKLRPSGSGEWAPIEHYFPVIEPTGGGGADWALELRRDPATVAAISSEWSGWQAFGGLSVRQPGAAGQALAPSAAVATLDFEVRGAPSPLVLTGDVDDLVVTNRSGSTIERALLIYSHAGGIGVTAVNELGPGDSSVTGLGPKEHPVGVLLELARGEMRRFFAARVGEELGAAIADAKSIPFLETPGLRLISMLETSAAPAALELSEPAAMQRHVVVSHSEILKPDEEEHVLRVVADETLDAARVVNELGRFSEGKLEYAAENGDDALRSRAQTLLKQIRSP
jgi:hypothetical protein